MSVKNLINSDKIPQHVAIIMDGNGRWAKTKGNNRIFGHQNGVNAVRDTVEAASEIGVKYLTLYAFSTENWNRPKLEINALMQLLMKAIREETPRLIKNNVRILSIGDLDSLPSRVKSSLERAKADTAHCNGLSLVLALSYSGRWEIANAAKQIAKLVANNLLNADDIDEKTIGKYLNTSNMPDPELIIRTSGEYRISNFLLWQIAYSEFYFLSKFWPDFAKEDFFEAIYNYQQRERRFGKISEQVNQIDK